MSKTQNPIPAELQAKFEQGMALHQQGKLAEAERVYIDILQQQPKHFDALHLLGVIAAQTQRPELAVELIGTAIELNDKFAGAYSNRGNALRSINRNEEALASYDRAIALQSDNFEVHCNRGIALEDLQRPEEALASFDAAIKLKPTYAEAHFNRGMTLQNLNRLEDALASYDKAIALNPNYAEAHGNRGNALKGLKRPHDAIASYDRAIALAPDSAEAYNNRGNALKDLDLTGDALASYDKAIALRPTFASAYYNRGNVLLQLERLDDALASYEKTIALAPDHAKAHYNRGVVLQKVRRIEDARKSYDAAIALRPDYAEAYSNRGNALKDLRHPEAALLSYDRAVELKPDYAEARWSRSLCLLQLGRFEQGWREYEWRKQRDEPVAVRSYAQPLWLGEVNIAGKTLFIYWEQGMGDTIQFARYAKLVEAQGIAVVMSVQRPLQQLLQQISPTIQILGPRETPTDFDYHCPLQSLPLALGTTLKTIPVEPQYLTADGELRAAWSARLTQSPKPRIGLVWRGSANHRNDQNRSIALEELIPLLHPDANWISLQKELNEQDVATLQKVDRIKSFAGDLKDFRDTAALLDLMDLVITVDTSVAHLAGAMGKPVWILLPSNSDWRWLLDRHDSPWYPSARLFRQQEFGNWSAVLDQVKNELGSVIR